MMWGLIGIIFIGTLISIFEVPPLIKKKMWRETTFFFVFLSFGLTLSILLFKGVTIPTPLDYVTKILSPVTTFVEGILS